MTFFRRKSWAQLTRDGIPVLVVLRPRSGGFTPPSIGEEYELIDPKNKVEVSRMRTMYEQKYIGTIDELRLLLCKHPSLDPELSAELAVLDEPLADVA